MSAMLIGARTRATAVRAVLRPLKAQILYFSCSSAASRSHLQTRPAALNRYNNFRNNRSGADVTLQFELLEIVRGDAMLIDLARNHGLSQLALMQAASDALKRKRSKMQLLFAKTNTGVGRSSQAFREELLELLVTSYKETAANQRLNVHMAPPHLWFTKAREMKRVVHLHAGPTNSGKTHSAMQALASANSGWYAGPLRLLAWEIHESLTNGSRGIAKPCNLLTGQEWVEIEGAQHTASTVEMTDTEVPMDVAVLDEIQMIGDEERGWAWTRALLGTPASELHVCGDSCCIPLVKKLCAAMGETVHVHEYERLAPLETLKMPVASLQDLQSGDCVVAFSKKTLYHYKAEIESTTGRKVSVIYGSLPPEMRREQAQLFNEGINSILVATDAVGMGLNLQIGRMLFSTMEKYDGLRTRRLSISEIKQIAGRAGRFKGKFPIGYVTSMEPGQNSVLEQCLALPTGPVHQAGLLPPFHILRAATAQQPDLEFAEVLRRFRRMNINSPDNLYFMCNLDTAIAVAEALEKFSYKELALDDRWTFCCAPVNMDILEHKIFLESIAKCVVAGVPCVVDKRAFSALMTKTVPTCQAEVSQLEVYCTMMDIYMWLAQKYGPLVFVDMDQANNLREECIHLIAAGLKKMSELALNSYQGPDPISAKERKSQGPSKPIQLNAMQTRGRGNMGKPQGRASIAKGNASQSGGLGRGSSTGILSEADMQINLGRKYSFF